MTAPAQIRAEQLHVSLMTRLNIFVFKKRMLQDRDWLARRLDLFERWTVPSVRWQVAPPDSWIIMIDETTHPDDVERVRAATAGLPVRVLILPSTYTARQYFALVTEALALDRPWLMTCRLDSDDSIGRQYIQTMRANATETAGEFLNLSTGFKLAGRRLMRVVEPSNPFLAFVEPRADELRTVYHVPHQHAATSMPVRQLDESPAWLTRLHDENMVSTISGDRVPLRQLTSAFPYSLTGIAWHATVAAVRRRTIHRAHVEALQQRRDEASELW